MPAALHYLPDKHEEYLRILSDHYALAFLSPTPPAVMDNTIATRMQACIEMNKINSGVLTSDVYLLSPQLRQNITLFTA